MNRTMHSISPARRSPRALGILFTASLLADAALAYSDTAVALPQPIVGAISRATVVGKPAPTQKLSIMVGVKLADLPGLEAFGKDVSNPKSRNYRRFLKPAEIGARFGQSATDLASVVTYLKGKGLTVSLASDNRTAIVATGTVKQAESAFGTTLASYQAATGEPIIGSRLFYANTTPPKLPTAVASKVTVVAGLDNFYRAKRRTAFLTPTQTRNLYKATTLYTDRADKGEGVTIAISNFDGFRLSNVPLYYSAFGLPTPAGGVGANVSVIPVAGGTGGTDPFAGEGDGDIQFVLAMTPFANLRVYDAPNTLSNYLILLAQEAQDNAADIITESYGWPTVPSLAPYYNQAHASRAIMSAEGITYLCASGDDGTYGPVSDTSVQYVYPDIDPLVLVVGGTVATIDGVGNRIAEDGWIGSGGGYITDSANFPYNTRPDWQQNITIPNDAAHAFRLFPDVALHSAGSNDANNQAFYDGYSFFQGGTLQGFSGTSAASPTLAGQLGLVLQQLRKDGAFDESTGAAPRLGLINPALYIAAADSSASVFTDITTGVNGLLPGGTVSRGTLGYDFVTGLGAPIIENLYQSYLSLIATPVDDSAVSAAPFMLTPTVPLGKVVAGDYTNLDTVDGSSFSISSVTQNGVGQVASATVGFNLQGDPAKRKSLKVDVTMSSPNLSVGYVYLKNYVTSTATKDVYDLVSTVNGSGSMKAVTVSFSGTVDLAKYAPSGTTSVLVRAQKPARLGAAPIRLDVDQVTLTERVTK